MTDETADLDRLFTRLADEGRPRDPNDHPAPEKLSAYLANELSPEEDDALQEHLTQCTLCADLLLDLQRFLDPPAEDRPREGVADFETAAEWRELKEKLRVKAPTAVRRRSLLRRISVAPVLAAALAFVFVGAAFQIMVLERRLSSPRAVQITTIEAQGSKKGTPREAEPTPFRLGNVAVFDTHSDHPYPKYRLVFKDKDGQVRRTEEAQEGESGMIALLLPGDFLKPGVYHVEVQGPEGAAANPIREFDIRILR
ncbi:MAG TPA: zf-HC2 domain-containing protein [Thermoanaerobaculia bacterium]|nr:zf-HC2 domain-containing protein [Thermoanaerobaculia bacterium]